MEWKKLLSYVTGSVDQELLLRNDYLAAEDSVLRKQIQGQLRLNDCEQKKLAEMGVQLGRKALAEVATVVRPEIILAWHRRLVARKFDGSKQRSSAGRPRLPREVEELVVRFAQENRGVQLSDCRLGVRI